MGSTDAMWEDRVARWLILTAIVAVGFLGANAVIALASQEEANNRAHENHPTAVTHQTWL